MQALNYSFIIYLSDIHCLFKTLEISPGHLKGTKFLLLTSTSGVQGNDINGVMSMFQTNFVKNLGKPKAVFFVSSHTPVQPRIVTTKAIQPSQFIIPVSYFHDLNRHHDLTQGYGLLHVEAFYVAFWPSFSSISDYC